MSDNLQCLFSFPTLKLSFYFFRENVQKSIPNYSDKDYWESRYANDEATDAKEESFDWYLDYAAFQSFLRQEMAATRRTPAQELRVLVPGCGDSLLCEDLVTQGG